MNIDQAILILNLALAICGFILIFLLLRNRRLRSLIKDLESIRSEVENESELNVRLLENNQKQRQEIEFLTQALNAMDFPCWIRDASLKIIFCNDRFAQLVDKTREIILANDAQTELFQNARELAQSVQEQHSLQRVTEHLIVDGERILYCFTELPLQEGQHTFGYAIDCSKLEEKERELENYISAQSDFLESTSSGIAIYGSDTRLRFFNQAFCHLWKLEEEWLKNNPTYGEILERLREKRRLPEQVNFREFKTNCLAMFKNLIEKQEEFYYLPDDQVLRVLVIPQNRGGLIFSYEDMTEHMKLERSYHTLISVKKSTLDNLFEGVAVFGENGKLQLSNPAYGHMWHLDLSVLSEEPHLSEILEMTKSFYEFGDNWPAFKQKILALLNRRELVKQRIERTDGSVLEWVCVPLPDGGTLMTYTDVTDSYLVEHSLRAEKEALKEADRLKTNFLSTVSYELRSPLTSIKGFSEVLLKKYFGDLNEKQAEYVRGIFESSLKLSGLIDNILEIASVDAGNIQLELKEFELYDVVSGVVSMISEAIKESNVRLLLECPQNIGKIYGDEKRIRQVISNLLDNAINFTGNSGSVRIKVFEIGEDEIAIAITDTGKGIRTEEQKDLFNRFHRSSTASGLGLGLPVAKSIVDIHGGRIELQSLPGKGTTVTCFFRRKHPKLLKQKRERDMVTIH